MALPMAPLAAPPYREISAPAVTGRNVRIRITYISQSVEIMHSTATA